MRPGATSDCPTGCPWKEYLDAPGWQVCTQPGCGIERPTPVIGNEGR